LEDWIGAGLKASGVPQTSTSRMYGAMVAQGIGFTEEAYPKFENILSSV
jgi:hypothetical protein